MDNQVIKLNSRDASQSMKDLVEAQTTKILEIIPDVVDQYKHDIKIAGKLQQHIAGDNLVNPSPVLTDPRAINDFLKRVDNIKLLLLKAAGLISPVAANVRIQQVFTQNNTNVLAPELFTALGGFLDLGDDEEMLSNSSAEDIIEAETIEVND